MAGIACGGFLSCLQNMNIEFNFVFAANVESRLECYLVPVLDARCCEHEERGQVTANLVPKATGCDLHY